MEIEATIEIARPLADVHAYLCDPAKLPDWIGGLVDFELGANGEFRHVISQAGRKMSVVGTITSEGPDLVRMQLSGDEGALVAEHRLNATPNGTRLDHTSTATIKNPLLRMLMSGMKEAARRRLGEDLERLRGQLEA